MNDNKEKFDKERFENILSRELDENELKEVVGAGNRCAPAVCHSTYNGGENCWLDDECNHFLNFYQGRR